MKREPTFGTQLTDASRVAHDELLDTIGRETLYGFVLYTSGESDFGYVCVSANTEEALRGHDELRWSVPDWKHHDFSSSVSAVELPAGEGRARDRKVYKDMIAALKTLDDERRFGRGAARARILLNVVCGDMSDEFFTKGLLQLNPKAVASAWIESNTAGPYLQRLENSLRIAQRLPAMFALWRDLALDRDEPGARAARARGITAYDLEPRITAFGAAAIPHLVGVIEEHGFSPAFNKKGSRAWDKHGACTVESKLATSAAFLLPRCGRADEANIERLQDVIRRRVELDRKVKTAVSTLAENLARNLHEMFPKRFPRPRMSDATNHLLDPGPFLPG